VAKKDKVAQQEAIIEVTSTVLGKQTKESKKIKVRPFVTTPAEVACTFGTWIPTGDYAGVKVDVTIKCPCYKEEIVPTFNQVAKLVDKLVDREVERLTKGMEDG
jgi:hypothetical protein